MSTYSNKLRRFEFTNILGWSYSRFDLFGQCKRKYYYQYYGKYDIESVLKINILKNLTSVPLEVGNISHKLIQRLLKRLQLSSEAIDLEKFFAYAERETLDVCKQQHFEDIYYKKCGEIDFKLEVFSKVSQAMENFLKSDRMQWMFEEALVDKENWIIEHDEKDKFGECRIDNLKSYCKVDFMFPIGNELHILDWKTGKENYSKHSTQLRGYAGWANFHFEKSYSQIKTTIAYLLPQYKETSVEITEYDIDEFAGRVKSQTEEMYKFCEEPELNIPLAKEMFKMTNAVNFCKNCNFRELCERH